MKELMICALLASCSVAMRGRNLRFTTESPGIAECRTRDGVEGECVPITECYHYQTRADILRDRPTTCRYQGKTSIICCKLRDSGFTLTGKERQEWEKVKEQIENATSEQLQQCGTTGDVCPPEYACLVGSQAAELGKWPWMALLGSTNTKRFKNTWYCGGVLVSRRHVVTAAHCIVESARRMIVRLGEYDLLLRGETEDQEVGVARVVKHPQYRGAQNDIAILELTPPVNFTVSVRPICLPPAGADFQGVRADLAGYGVTEYAGETTPNVLQELTLLVADENECENTFKDTPSFPRKFPGGFQGTKICCVDPQGGNKDACSGDSGGPLVYQSPGTGVYQLIGVVSTGVGCGNPQFPGIYTKVSAYIDWINQVTGA